MTSTPKTPFSPKRQRPSTAAAPELSPEPSQPTSNRWRFLRSLTGFSRKAIKTALDSERQLLVSLQERSWPTLRQLRHAHRILSIKERRTVTISLAVITAAVVWMLGSGALAHIVTRPADGGTYTEGQIGQPRFINPLYASGSSVDNDLTRLIFSGLLRYDTNLQLQPDLAESYEISPDGKVYTVRLRSGLHWHDGEPLSINDVVFTYTSIGQEASGSALAVNFKGVVVEKADDRTIRFTLKDAYPAFGHLLTTGIIPEHIWSKIPQDQWQKSDSNTRPVGAGPWQFDTLTANPDNTIKQYTLVRAPAREGVGRPHLNQIIFKFYPDETAARDALSSRAIEGLALVGQSEPRSFVQNRHVVSYDLALPAVTAVFFNVNVPSPAQAVAVRRALRDAIDTRVIIQQVLGRNATVAHGPLPSTEAGRTAAPASKTPDELLTDAGWTRVGALRQNKQGSTLSISLTVMDRQPDRAVAEQILLAWQNLGVETRIDLVSPADPANTERSVLRPRSYQALLFTTVYGAVVDPYPYWHSSQRVDPGLNLSVYANQDLDNAIEKMRRSMTTVDRQAAATTLQKIIYDDAPAAFLYAPVRHYLMSDEIHGVALERIATPADRFNGLDQWFVKTAYRWQ